MNTKALLALAAVMVTMAPAAFADHDKIEVIQRTEGSVAVPQEVTTVETVDPGVAVVRTHSEVVETPKKTKTVIKEKKAKRHLLKLPFVTLF